MEKGEPARKAGKKSARKSAKKAASTSKLAKSSEDSAKKLKFCKNCAHGEAQGEKAVLCRRFPKASGANRQPIMRADDWCGEFAGVK